MRRAIAVAVSLILAIAGTFLLVRYVQGAEDRALEGEVLVDVLVVDDIIRRGSSVEDLAGRVKVEQVPAKVAADGVVTDLETLAGMVVGVDLLPGEQVMAARFMTRDDYLVAIADEPPVPVPPDKLEVTLSLSPERAVGGELRPGDLVAVLASFDPFTYGAVEPGEEAEDVPIIYPWSDPDLESLPELGLQTPNSTGIILHKVLVTFVQTEELPRDLTEDEIAAGLPELAPTGNLLITLAIGPVDAERVVFSAEHGTVWIAREGPDVDETPTPIQTRATIYEPR
jgi:pilus assembly protein CpaB